MANKKIINIGNQSNDGTGDTIRDAFDKVNSNFDDLYNVAGLGDGLRFIKLREAPPTLEADTILGINTSATRIVQRTLVASTGVSITLTDGEIIIANTASNLKSDASPVLGGNLDGLFSHKGVHFADPFNDYDTVTKKWVYDNFLNRDAKYESDDTVDGNPTPVTEGSTIRHNPIAINTATKAGHLVNKEYADRKISLAGAYSVDPATGAVNTSMGYMSGPLILFRDPITQDDVDYDGQIAATKKYVDSSSFVSSVNFYVATSGRDNRTDIPAYKKGRALAYAFKTIGKAAEAAEQMLNISQVVLGPYQKIVTTNNNLTDVTIIDIVDSPYVTDATRVTVNWNGGEGRGTDAYANGSLFPGCYLQGESTGAIGLIEKVGYTSSPNEEHYDVVLVDYADTIVSDLTPLGTSLGGTITLQFNTANLVNIPDFWKGYKFVVDTGGEGTIVDTGYYTDPVTQNVYDRITVNFSTPLSNLNAINGMNWHVYSGYFQLGEKLKWGQRQDKTQITIMVESGEHHEQYPIRLSRNCSIRGDEFRRSIPRPATFVNSDLPTISVSPWANLYFRRDTQVDGILVAQLDTVDFVETSGYFLTATPDQTENDSVTGVVTFTVTATQNSNPVPGWVVPATWKGKVFVGHGGNGEIVSVSANTFSVNLAENSSYQRKLTSSTAKTNGQWHVYEPINHGYHYLRNAKKPVNYVIQNQNGNYLTSKRLLQLNRGYIQAEVAAYIDYEITQGSGIWSGFTYDREKCVRDVGTIVDAICADLDAGNISNSLTAADAYRYVSVVQNSEIAQTVAAIEKIGELAQRIVQNIPTGTGSTIHSYQTVQEQVFDRTTYQGDMAVIDAVIGFAVDASTVNLIDPGLGYQYPPTITFSGGNPDRIARATATVDVDGIITGLVFSDTGDGYTEAPIVIVTPNGRTPSVPANIEVSLMPTGKIKSVSLKQGGRGYYDTPTVKLVGDGVGAVVSVTTGTVGPYSEVVSVSLDDQGSDYSQAYVQISGGTFNYNKTKCARDVGLIVDDIAKDIQFGGQSQTTFAGIQYWNHNGYTGQIGGELTTTSNAISHIKEVAKKIIVNDTSGTRYTTGQQTGSAASSAEVSTVDLLFTTINDILLNGITGVTDRIVANSLTASTNAAVLNAYALLQLNRDYLRNEAVAFVEATKTPGFTYDQQLCSRDVGYMVDSICNDLKYGGNRQTIQSGTYYYGYNANSSALPGEQTQAVAAYNYIKTLLPNIIKGVQITGTYQSAVPQVRTGPFGDNAAASSAQSCIDNITNIITNGPSGVTKIPLGITPGGDTNAVNGAAVIRANKAFLQAEVDAYIAKELDGGNIDNSLVALSHLTSGIASIVGGNPDFNPPKYNDEMDAFLMNDATIIRYISCQGHGGFMKVLDPEGQILAKSPYTQTASSFSRSRNRHVFSGGLLVDGFTGNLQMQPRANSAGKLEAEPDLETGTLTKIFVQGLHRRPQTPCFFVNGGISYEVDFISEFQEDGTGNGTYEATLNLNPARPGGFSSGRISATGFQGSKTLPVSIASPTVAGGVKAAGTITTDGAGHLTGTSIDFTSNGVGYETTAVNLVVGGAVINFPLNSAGSVDTDNIQIVNSGTGYVTGCTVNFAPSGSGATAVATLTAASGLGGITSFTFSNTGSGYATSPTYWFGSNWNQSMAITNGYIGTLPSTIETITAGNRSMLANDFTQMNDLGYGIFVTNGGFMENVSMFTYYCWTSYYALNGSQVRTITGSSAYGNYGLISEGSDPLETPIALTNLNDTNQVVTFQNSGGYVNVLGANIVYALIPNFEPYGKSEVEVNHYGVRKIYNIVSATKLTDPTVPANYYMLSLDTNGEKWFQTMTTGETLSGTYRTKFQQKFSGINPSVLTRTATVINFDEDPQTTYKVSAYSYQGNDISVVSSNNAYNYISIQPWVESTYRQGVYNVTKSSGTGYTPGTVVTVTFATPTTITASSAVATDSQVSTSSVVITSASGPIHVGMTCTSSDSVIQQNIVTWVNTSTSSPTRIGLATPIKGLSAGATLTFYGKAAKGTATAASDGTISSISITESGIGYTSNDSGTNGPLPASVSSGNLTITGAKVAGITGSTVIKVSQLKALDAARIRAGLAASTPYYYVFGYEGFLLKITGYKTPDETGQQWGELTVQRVNQAGNDITPNGLPLEMMADNLYAGIQRNQTARITVKISTIRATSHDMVDIGTGGYATSKIPNDLYGPPIISPSGSQEVIELKKGRVFYVTTDQDGTFSVGGYLVVDQARGQVSLNAPVALANLPSIKLQKGQLIDDFSADPALTGESNSTVPTERALVQFIERRLGTSRAGVGTTLGLIGPGYIDRAGVQGMLNRLDMGNYAIQNLKAPGTAGTDAATRNYVDTRISLAGTDATYNNGSYQETHDEWGKMTGPLWAHADPVAGDPALQMTTKRYVDQQVRQLATLSDVVFTSPQDIDLVGFSSTVYSVNTSSSKPIWHQSRQVVNLANNVTTPTNNATVRSGGSDVDFVRSANTITIKLLGSAAGDANEQYNPITDYHVNSAAQIRQYKLLMTQAATTATAPAGTQQEIQHWLGVSAFDDSQFTASNGWISLRDSSSITTGIPVSKLQRAPAHAESTGLKGGIIGTTSTAASNFSYLSSGTVVDYLEALTKDGRMTLTGSLVPAYDASNALGVNLGSSIRSYKNVYSDTFTGTATKAISLLSSLAAQTYVQASTSTANATIVQRDATGYINGVMAVDHAGAVFPATKEDADIGLSNKRFNNVYTKTVSAGSDFSGNLFGSWTLVGITGSNRPELLGPDNGTAANGANIGRDNAVGRINQIFTRYVKADDARVLGMTVTNAISAGSAVVTGAAQAGSLTLSTTPLDIHEGGTGARDIGGVLDNLLPAGVTVGTVLTFGGAGSYYWSSVASGGGSNPQGTRITVSRQTFTVPGTNGDGTPITASTQDFIFTSYAAQYTAGANQLRVFINGVRQFPSEITEISGGNGVDSKASFRITSGVSDGDVIFAEIDSFYEYPTLASSIGYAPSGSMSSIYDTVQKGLDYIESDKMRKSGGTFTGDVTFAASKQLNIAAGTTSKYGLKFSAGSLLTVPTSGAVEWDGSTLYITQASGPTRKTVAYQEWVTDQGFAQTGGSYADPTWITSLAASKVGLGNVTNESKATMFTNAALTGSPTAPTPTSGSSNTQIATKEYADSIKTYAVPSGGIIMWSGSIATIPSGWVLCDGSNSTPDLRDKFVMGAGSSYSVAATGGSKDAVVVSHSHNVTIDSKSLTGRFDVAAQSGFADGIASQESSYSGNGADPHVNYRIKIDATHDHTATAASTGASATNANLPPYYALAYIMKT